MGVVKILATKICPANHTENYSRRNFYKGDVCEFLTAMQQRFENLHSARQLINHHEVLYIQAIHDKVYYMIPVMTIP